MSSFPIPCCPVLDISSPQAIRGGTVLGHTLAADRRSQLRRCPILYFAMPPPLTVVANPSTALVFSFGCLYTHDIRRKQKRWQDGKLSFHGFNNRVMVYDQHGNFIGDTHWRGTAPLQDGDEFELDRGGAIVQVAELLGEKEQDLTEIFAKRKSPIDNGAVPREGQCWHSQSHSSRSQHQPIQDAQIIPSTSGQRLGRASISNISPFQERQTQPTELPPTSNYRALKKQRVHRIEPFKSSFATGLFGASLDLSYKFKNISPARNQELLDACHRQPEGGISARQMTLPLTPLLNSSVRNPGSTTDRESAPTSHSIYTGPVTMEHAQNCAIDILNGTTGPQHVSQSFLQGQGFGVSNFISISAASKTANSPPCQENPQTESYPRGTSNSFAPGPMDDTCSESVKYTEADETPSGAKGRVQTTKLQLGSFRRRGLLVAGQLSERAMPTCGFRAPPEQHPGLMLQSSEPLHLDDTRTHNYPPQIMDTEASAIAGICNGHQQDGHSALPISNMKVTCSFSLSSEGDPKQLSVGNPEGPWSREAYDLLDHERPVGSCDATLY